MNEIAKQIAENKAIKAYAEAKTYEIWNGIISNWVGMILAFIVVMTLLYMFYKLMKD